MRGKEGRKVSNLCCSVIPVKARMWQVYTTIHDMKVEYINLPLIICSRIVPGNKKETKVKNDNKQTLKVYVINSTTQFIYFTFCHVMSDI